MNIDTENDWRSPKIELPPQGLKVICFDEGDVWCGVRFGDLWSSRPFSKSCGPEAPQLWRYCKVPEPYTGYAFISVTGDPKDVISFDELEKEHPKIWKKMYEMTKRMWTDPKVPHVL